MGMYTSFKQTVRNQYIYNETYLQFQMEPTTNFLQELVIQFCQNVLVHLGISSETYMFEA